MSQQERGDESRNRLLATFAHEVKTPLAGIRLSLDMLLEEKLGTVNAAQRELLDIGQDNCRRLLTMLQAFLELARWEGGQAELRPEPQAPAELLGEVASAQGDAVRRTGGELQLEIPAGLPLVLADLLQANRVLGIFLANAGKYGTPGRPVLLRARERPDGFVRLSVLNHGRCLSEAEQLRVFEPFFRVPGQSAEGTGLALAICRAIAALHGGRVGVDCPAGSECVEFYFDLRRAG